MNKKYIYRVAGHVMELRLPQGDPLGAQLAQYEPFLVDRADEEPVFSLEVLTEQTEMGEMVQEIHQDDDGSEILAGRVDDRPCFDFLHWGRWQARLMTGDDYREATLYAEGNRLFGLNNAMMVMFALSTSDKQTMLMPSSVVSFRGTGYMFLGKSGTGKSTHSQLWLNNISGTELVNDDNPAVRIGNDGVARVYGTPWSGKTPCYRNVSYPVGAIVQLSQAPLNEIRRLKGIQAYVALKPSVSGKRWDRRLADGLHETENWVAGHVPMFHLRCLPDRDAAMTCMEAVAPFVEASRLKTVDNNIIIGEVASLVREGRPVILPVKGNSMLPFIVGSRDSAELSLPKGPLTVGDAVLAWVDDSRYVLHRIINISDDGKHLVLMGDGNIRGVEHCRTSDVVAVANYVIKPNGKRKYLYSDGQRRAWRLWNWLRPVRRLPLAIMRRIVWNRRSVA